MASDAGMTAIFFTRILGRVQFHQDTKPVKRAEDLKYIRDIFILASKL
ncbi:hypothetical protein AB3331_08590 [Streptococcus sp. H49]